MTWGVKQKYDAGFYSVALSYIIIWRQNKLYTLGHWNIKETKPGERRLLIWQLANVFR
jgi:hypothetical protein